LCIVNKHKLHLNEGQKISIISKIKNNEHCFELHVQKESGGEQQQHEFLALPEQSYSKKIKS
jgi:predicted DNA-binding antitoxin AbrB/MazE fold protein